MTFAFILKAFISLNSIKRLEGCELRPRCFTQEYFLHSHYEYTVPAGCVSQWGQCCSQPQAVSFPSLVSSAHVFLFSWPFYCRFSTFRIVHPLFSSHIWCFSANYVSATAIISLPIVHILQSSSSNNISLPGNSTGTKIFQFWIFHASLQTKQPFVMSQ